MCQPLPHMFAYLDLLKVLTFSSFALPHVAIHLLPSTFDLKTPLRLWSFDPRQLIHALKALRAVRMLRYFRFIEGIRLLLKACSAFLPPGRKASARREASARPSLVRTRSTELPGVTIFTVSVGVINVRKGFFPFNPPLCGDFDHGTVRRPENPNINVSRNSQFQKGSQSHADLLYLVAGKLETLLCKQSPKVTK